MGARYLDPKYSRWISTDPALGEYIPGAGKANARDAGGLPGMGGIFNSVNLSLFHYAGNNPVRYVDPDGTHIDDWKNNGDGTWTVIASGAKLWDIYGANWREESGYAGDPTKLQIGDTVGKAKYSILLTTEDANRQGIKSKQIPTFYFDTNNDYQYYDSNGNLVLIGYALPNIWEMWGDALSAGAFLLNCANAGCSICGQFSAAAGCGTVSMIFDIGATICYFAGECNYKGVISLGGVVLDLIPYAAYAFKPSLQPAYNLNAKRFINPATKKFITNSSGYRNYLLGPTTGITYYIGSNIYCSSLEE